MILSEEEGTRRTKNLRAMRGNTIAKLAREAAKRRIALGRIAMRFGGSLASVQAERPRARASGAQTGGDKQRAKLSLAGRLVARGADSLEGLADVISSLDSDLSSRRQSGVITLKKNSK